MKEIRFSPEASADLGQIRRDTRRKWGNAALERFDLRLTTRMMSLAGNPKMGPQRNELHFGLRSLSFPPFVIFYREHGNFVDIVRVYDARRDYTRTLRAYLNDDKNG